MQRFEVMTPRGSLAQRLGSIQRLVAARTYIGCLGQSHSQELWVLVGVGGRGW